MKILVVLPRFPYPLEKGDKLRAYHQIVELSKRHEIYLFCVSHTKVSDEQRAALEPYCKDIRIVHLNRVICWVNIIRNWFSSKSLQMGYWNTAHSKHVCRNFAREVKPDIVYNQMVRTMPLVARLPYPKVMDFQDALSMNTERRMEHSHGLWHYILHFEFKMLRSSEYKAFSIFDALTIISDVDSEAIPHKKNGEIRIVPNGVDFDHFKMSDELSSKASETLGHFSIVFCGNMSYAPNVDAARYLVEEVMPLVWENCPFATVLIAGAFPKPTVRALASKALKREKVTVSGHLPDIRTAYAAADLFVAPMRIGSGLQNKLLEAMSMQVPCVTTSLANDALGATSGDQLFVGDNKEELAYWISLLLGSEEVRSRIAHEGNLFVRENYSWQAAVQPLENIFNAILAQQKR